MTIRIKIGSQSYPVHWQDNECPSNRDKNGPIYGSCSEDDGIELNPELSPPVAASTAIHEVLHMICRVYRIKPRMSEEQMCLTLEGPLLAFLTDNPRFVNQLRAAAKGKPMTGIAHAT